MKTDVHQTIGSAIKSARNSLGLSQEELGKLLGYDNGQFVSDWERGYSAIPMKKLAQVAQILKLDHKQLFDMLLDFSVDRLRESMQQEFHQQIVSARKSQRK